MVLHPRSSTWINCSLMANSSSASLSGEMHIVHCGCAPWMMQTQWKSPVCLFVNLSGQYIFSNEHLGSLMCWYCSNYKYQLSTGVGFERVMVCFFYLLSPSHLSALSLLIILPCWDDSVVSPSFPMRPCPVLCLFVWSLPLGHCPTSVEVCVYMCISVCKHECILSFEQCTWVVCASMWVSLCASECVYVCCNQCVIPSLRPLFHTAGLREPLEGFCAIQASFALSTWPGGVCGVCVCARGCVCARMPVCVCFCVF